jgi:hypothetical protein
MYNVNVIRATMIRECSSRRAGPQTMRVDIVPSRVEVPKKDILKGA